MSVDFLLHGNYLAEYNDAVPILAQYLEGLTPERKQTLTMRTAVTDTMSETIILPPEGADFVVFEQPIYHAEADDATYLDYIGALKAAADLAFSDHSTSRLLCEVMQPIVDGINHNRLKVRVKNTLDNSLPLPPFPGQPGYQSGYQSGIRF